MNFSNLLALNDPEYLISSPPCLFKQPQYLFLPEELCTYVQYFSSSLLRKTTDLKCEH
jgi:hypothetical protein